MYADDEMAMAASPARRRAAFDIGSGATKMMIADVVGTSVREVYFGQEVPVPFAMAWKRSLDGALDEAIQLEGLEVLRRFLEIAAEHGVVGAGSSCAVATEVFRKASNGGAYLERVRQELGLSIEVVTQSVEAELGFRTAVALQDGPPESVICWDSGGASFQITASPQLAGDAAESSGDALPLLRYMGALGTGVTTALLIEEVQGRCLADTSTPNPVSAEHAERLVDVLLGQLAQAPAWLSGASTVTAIGGINSMFAVAAQALESTAYTAADVRRALDDAVGLTDEEMAERPYCQGSLREPAGFIVPKLALLLAVMTRCEMHAVQYCSAIGSCPGLLISEQRYADSASVDDAILSQPE